MKWLLILYIILFLSSIAYSQDFNIPAEGAEWNTAEIQGTTYCDRCDLVTTSLDKHLIHPFQFIPIPCMIKP